VIGDLGDLLPGAHPGDLGDLGDDLGASGLPGAPFRVVVELEVALDGGQQPDDLLLADLHGTPDPHAGADGSLTRRDQVGAAEQQPRGLRARDRLARLGEAHKPVESSDVADRREARVGRDPRGTGRAINPRTAMMFFLQSVRPAGAIKPGGMAQVGREGYPDVPRRRADVPPISRFSEYIREGFDLVTFSGGKRSAGPQASGLLLGRPD